MLKIGTKVRFLNDVGGGVVTGFQGKDVVLVSDADGFEIPTLIKDVVVVETDNYDKHPAQAADKSTQAAPAAQPATHTSVRQALAHTDSPDDDEPETDVADLALTYRPMAQTRHGADQLCALLAFVVDPKMPADGEPAFDVYFINDCNYYLHFTLLTHHDDVCQLLADGEVMPHTKQHLATLHRADLALWEKLTCQALAYKREKAFKPKPAAHVPLRIDGKRFYRLATFQSSPYFTAPAYLCPVLRDDAPVHEPDIDAEALHEALHTHPATHAATFTSTATKAAPTPGKQSKPGVVEVDLHAHALLDTLVGLEARDILDYQLKVFDDTMRTHLKARGTRIVFIHGKGDGVLRHALLSALKQRYASCHVQDASFREYGFGATQVTIA